MKSLTVKATTGNDSGGKTNNEDKQEGGDEGRARGKEHYSLKEKRMEPSYSINLHGNIDEAEKLNK